MATALFSGTKFGGAAYAELQTGITICPALCVQSG
jgi:hypothetical protein